MKADKKNVAKNVKVIYKCKNNFIYTYHNNDVRLKKKWNFEMNLFGKQLLLADNFPRSLLQYIVESWKQSVTLLRNITGNSSLFNHEIYRWLKNCQKKKKKWSEPIFYWIHNLLGFGREKGKARTTSLSVK